MRRSLVQVQQGEPVTERRVIQNRFKCEKLLLYNGQQDVRYKYNFHAAVQLYNQDVVGYHTYLNHPSFQLYQYLIFERSIL